MIDFYLIGLVAKRLEVTKAGVRPLPSPPPGLSTPNVTKKKKKKDNHMIKESYTLFCPIISQQLNRSIHEWRQKEEKEPCRLG